MKRSLEVLHPYEFDALLEALRRDMRTQFDQAKLNGTWMEWHNSNAHLSKRILEALNPKTVKTVHQTASRFPEKSDAIKWRQTTVSAHACLRKMKLTT